MILVIGVTRISAPSLTNEVGIGSRLHDLVGGEFKILRRLSSDTGTLEDRAVLLLLGLVVKTGTNECSTKSEKNVQR